MKKSDSEKLFCQDTPLSGITELFFGVLQIEKENDYTLENIYKDKIIKLNQNKKNNQELIYY